MRRIHLCCPYDGRKLSKVEAMDVATTNVRRTCPACKRRLTATIQPIADTTPRYVVTIGEAR